MQARGLKLRTKAGLVALGMSGVREGVSAREW